MTDYLKLAEEELGKVRHFTNTREDDKIRISKANAYAKLAKVQALKGKK